MENLIVVLIIGVAIVYVAGKLIANFNGKGGCSCSSCDSCAQNNNCSQVDIKDKM